MAGDQDSWLSGLGVDVDGIIGAVQEKASAVVGQATAAGAAVLEEARQVVTTAAAAVTGAAPPPPAAPSPKPAAKPPAAKPAAAGGGLSLTGSVGAGGQNQADDVKAVQTALGVTPDGSCGPVTIGAIKAFQQSLGQANPDGRVDAGGPTARALAGGKGAAPAAPTTEESPPAAETAAPTGDSPSLLDRAGSALSGLADAASGMASAAAEAAGGVAGAAASGVGRVVAGAKELGEGAVDGMLGAAGKVVDGAKALVDSASSGLGGSGSPFAADLRAPTTPSPVKVDAPGNPFEVEEVLVECEKLTIQPLRDISLGLAQKAFTEYLSAVEQVRGEVNKKYADDQKAREEQLELVFSIMLLPLSPVASGASKAISGPELRERLLNGIESNGMRLAKLAGVAEREAQVHLTASALQLATNKTAERIIAKFDADTAKSAIDKATSAGTKFAVSAMAQRTEKACANAYLDAIKASAGDAQSNLIKFIQTRANVN